MEESLAVPGPRPHVARLTAREFDAARALVTTLDAEFGGDAILGLSVDRVLAMATTPNQRGLVERLIDLRPTAIGIDTPATGPVGRAPEPDLTVVVTVDIDTLMGAADPRALAAGHAVVRISGQRYYSERQGAYAPMKDVLMASSALEGFVAMQRAIQADLGRPLLVMSQHRSRGHQLAVILRDVVANGGDLTTVLNGVALPGFSEHQDLAHPAFDLAAQDGRLGDAFRHTPEYAWLRHNAARFGFALSYPDDNTSGIKSEPWHWRYVGDVAPLGG